MGLWRAVKLCRHFAAGRALAHHAGIGSFAQGQLQGVNENRFAGARFACEHAETL